MSEGDGDRVLDRAAELERQLARRAALDVARLLERGAEAGLDEAFVRLAIAERQLRLPTTSGTRGFAAWLAGPHAVRGMRRVPVSSTTALSRISLWVEVRTRMVSDERIIDGASWRHRSRLTRGWHRDAEDHLLERVDRVGAVVEPVGKDDSLVLLAADMRVTRALRIALAAAVAVLVVWATAALDAEWWVALPLVVLAPWLVLAGQRRSAERVVLDVDAMIGALPEDVPPPGARRSLFNRANRSLHGRTM
jgi:hypothetical protein